jgi:hypothetical protein
VGGHIGTKSGATSSSAYYPQSAAVTYPWIRDEITDSPHFLNILLSLDNNLLCPSPSSSPPLPLSSLLAPRATAYRFLYSPGSSMPTPFFHIPLLAALDDQHNNKSTLPNGDKTVTLLPLRRAKTCRVPKVHTLHHSLRTWWQYRPVASRGRANSQSTCKGTRAGMGAEQEVSRSVNSVNRHVSSEQATDSQRDHTGPYG